MFSSSPNNAIPDENSLYLLKAGNEDAFDIIYHRYSLAIYRKLLQMVKIESIAEELTQEIFIKIWEKRNLIDPEKPFRSYITKITNNQVIDFYRKASRSNRLKKTIERIGSQACDSAEENFIQKESKDIVQDAVEHLPPQQKLVFNLCKIEGHTYEEVSHLLGISTATVNNHIVRATKSIKHYLNRNYLLVIALPVLASLI